jgi:hypothetical protein
MRFGASTRTAMRGCDDAERRLDGRHRTIGVCVERRADGLCGSLSDGWSVSDFYNVYAPIWRTCKREPYIARQRKILADKYRDIRRKRPAFARQLFLLRRDAGRAEEIAWNQEQTSRLLPDS